MKLYPKARPVRIKLNVGGEEHSSLDSLRANFNVEEVLQLYASGGLKNWLRQIKRLDILDMLSKIDDDVITEQYRKCILIFFDTQNDDENRKFDLSGKNQRRVEEILLKWYDEYPNSFRFLLSSVKTKDIQDDLREENDDALSSISSLLSVDLVRKIDEKASKCKDVETQQRLRNYLYKKIMKTLNRIQKTRLILCYNSDSVTEDSNNLEAANYNLLTTSSLLLKPLLEEWNIDYEEVLQPKIDLSKLLYPMIEDAMVIDYKEELNQTVSHMMQENNHMNKTISDVESETLKKMIDFIRSVTNDIEMGHMILKDFGLPLFELLGCKHSLTITKTWYKLPYILQKFNSECSLDVLIAKWGNLCVYIYLYSYLLGSPRINKYNDAINFLKNNQGRHGLYVIRHLVGEKCNKETIESLCEVRKKIFQSALFIAELCSDLDVKSTYRMLHETGYRPASLMFGFQPRTEMEKTFMRLSNLERIPFIAEHILDF